MDNMDIAGKKEQTAFDRGFHDISEQSIMGLKDLLKLHNNKGRRGPKLQKLNKMRSLGTVGSIFFLYRVVNRCSTLYQQILYLKLPASTPSKMNCANS